MATTTIYTGELIVEQCWCGIQHAVPASLIRRQRDQQNAGQSQLSIYCPLGHAWTRAGTSEVDLLKRQIEQEQNRTIAERQRHDQTRAELRETENKRRAEKAAKTRMRNRIANGVCPCCNRYFAQLARHMANQHPEFTAPSPA